MRLTWKQIHKDLKTIFALNSSGVFLSFLMGLLFIEPAGALSPQKDQAPYLFPRLTSYYFIQ